MLDCGVPRAGSRVGDGPGVGFRRARPPGGPLRRWRWRRSQPSVVSITSEKKAASTSRWPFTPEENQRPRVSGMGTGVILDGRGYILTNHHVVDKVQGIEVHLADGTSYPARLLQFDPVMDLAMLKIEADRPLAGDRHRHVVRPDGRRVGDHDRQRLRLREHGLRRDRQRPEAQRHALRRAGLPQPDPDRRCDQPGQLGGSADQHRRRADRHQRRGPRRGAGDRVRLADRRREGGGGRDDEHPPAGADLARPGRGRDAQRVEPCRGAGRGAGGQSRRGGGLPVRATRSSRSASSR